MSYSLMGLDYCKDGRANLLKLELSRSRALQLGTAHSTHTAYSIADCCLTSLRYHLTPLSRIMMSMNSWKKTQAASGLAFGLFVMLHLACHWTLSISWETGQSALLAARSLYRNPVVEGLMAIVFAIHLASNFSMYLARERINAHAKKEGGKEPTAGKAELFAHRAAGYFLWFGIILHVAAVRLGPLFFLPDPADYDYSFIAAAYNHMPQYVFPGYLFLLGATGGWHMIYGTRSALSTLSNSTVAGKPFPILLKVVALVFHLLTLSAVLALAGYYYPVDTESKKDLHWTLFKGIGMI